jgi:FHS family L-fucose permease-like MFS transporter
MLGAPQTAHSRLTFAQAFNSLGTTVFPYVGAILILGSLAKVDQATLSAIELAAYRAAESQVVVNTYIGLAIALAVVAAMVWINRNKLAEHTSPEGSILNAFNLLQRPRFAFGALCIFLYVGAEVAVGSLITNYLMQFDVLGLGMEAAGKHVGLYWGGAMVGRFLGAYVLRICSPGKVLAVAGGLAALLLLLSANTTGAVSGWSLLAIGLVNSIMFPTIFTLASEGLGERAAEGSGLICMAIVGGAIVPLITGVAADASSLRMALAVPAVCYLLILAFGWYARRPLQNC